MTLTRVHSWAEFNFWASIESVTVKRFIIYAYHEQNLKSYKIPADKFFQKFLSTEVFYW